MATSDTDFETFTVLKLKQYLRDHGQYVTGNKGELVARAKGVLLLGKKPSQSTDTRETIDVASRRAERLTTPFGEKLPDPKTLTGWDTDVAKIPDFTKASIYSYLVENKSATIDMSKNFARRQLKAKVFNEDRHVYSVLYHEVDEQISHCFVKAKVMPSLPGPSRPDYETWVCLSKEFGHVHAAWCQCSAGEGESCNHIAGLLYSLVEITDDRKEGKLSSTSIKQKWGTGSKRPRHLSPRKAEDMKHRKYDYSESDQTNDVTNSDDDSQSPSVMSVAPVNVERFSSKIQGSHAAWLQSLATAPIRQAQLPRLHNINYMYLDQCELSDRKVKEELDAYFLSLQGSMSEVDCDKIEMFTRGQNKNRNWGEAKYGRLTSSNFGSVCKRRDSTNPDGLVRSIFRYSTFRSVCTTWGISHEPAARRVYARELKKLDATSVVQQSGLIVNPRYPHLGASPDGLVKTSQGLGVVEIKCPHKYQLIDPKEASKEKDFCCYLNENNKLTLKRNHDYYYQVQGQLAITQRNWCDFFVWTLAGFDMERIEFDSEFWESCLSKLNTFYVQGVLPELFTTRVLRGKNLYPN